MQQIFEVDNAYDENEAQNIKIKLVQFKHDIESQISRVE
jgi:hypothetical protein